MSHDVIKSEADFRHEVDSKRITGRETTNMKYFVGLFFNQI
jgi:hypothetical protein